MSDGIGAVVLAAGAGTRFVGPTHKLRADLRGRPVVSWVIDTAIEAAIGPVAVVTGAVDLADLIPAPVTELPNPDWLTGQASSLQAAIRWGRRNDLAALVVGLGDQPFITADTWRRVSACEAPIAVADFGGRRRPPTRLSREIWSLLPTEGDEGARPLIMSRPDLVTEVGCQDQPTDLDTVEDLEQWS